LYFSVFGWVCSSDGKQLVYGKRNKTNSNDDIYTYDIENGIEKQLTNTGHVYNPLCSPDGSIIIYFSNNQQKIIAIDSSGASKYDIPVDDLSVYAFSPSGNRLAYTTYTDNNGIIIVDASDGQSNKVEIGRGNGQISILGWTQDEK